MDKDTKHTLETTCERAKDELSGYLDNVLDPRMRQAVEAHLANCPRCQAILADFRRGDEMLQALPFIEPPPDMRDRFFNSPEYLAAASARTRQRSFVTPLTGALVAAAMIVLALGGALLFRQDVFGSQQAGRSATMTTIGNAGNSVPLPSGPRLLYARDGALWSAPESGVGLPRQLTRPGVQVAAWHVSPNGRMVLYIDARTGALHTVRADGLNDTAVGSVTGGKAPAAGFWTTVAGAALAHGIAWSPDNTRVAYLAQTGNGVALHVMNATGAADVVARAADGAQPGQPLWSADSVYIAYTLGQSGAQSIQVYNVTTAHTVAVASQSDASDAAATVDRIAWLSGSVPAALTWSAQDHGAITGVFRADGSANDSAIRLTPTGARYSAADVSASGAWLLASGAHLSQIALGQTGPQVVATLSHPVTLVRWAPSGQLAAVVVGGDLAMLAPGRPLAVVASGLATSGAVAWSPDSSLLAWQSGDGVTSARIHQGAVGAAQTVARNVVALDLAWAPDGQSLAIHSSAGLLVVTADGAHVRASDGHMTSGGQFAWSLAG